jgi:hypothetical protein
VPKIATIQTRTKTIGDSRNVERLRFGNKPKCSLGIEILRWDPNKKKYSKCLANSSSSPKKQLLVNQVEKTNSNWRDAVGIPTQEGHQVSRPHSNGSHRAWSDPTRVVFDLPETMHYQLARLVCK